MIAERGELYRRKEGEILQFLTRSKRERKSRPSLGHYFSFLSVRRPSGRVAKRATLSVTPRMELGGSVLLFHNKRWPQRGRDRVQR